MFYIQLWPHAFWIDSYVNRHISVCALWIIDISKEKEFISPAVTVNVETYETGYKTNISLKIYLSVLQVSRCKKEFCWGRLYSTCDLAMVSLQTNINCACNKRNWNIQCRTNLCSLESLKNSLKFNKTIGCAVKCTKITM